MEDFGKALNDLIVNNLSGVGIVLTYALIALVLSFPVKRLLRLLPGRWGKSLAGPVGDLTQILLVVVGIFFGTRQAGADVTILLAASAILTAGMSLALDTSVKDAIASMKILANRYYTVGQSISFDALTGRVHHISLFATTLYISDRGLVTVANSKVADGPITNHSIQPVELQIRIPVLSTINRRWAIENINNQARACKDIVSSKVIHVWEPGGSEIYTIFAKVADYDRRREIATDVSITISDWLESEGYTLGEVSLRKQI